MKIISTQVYPISQYGTGTGNILLPRGKYRIILLSNGGNGGYSGNNWGAYYAGGGGAGGTGAVAAITINVIQDIFIKFTNNTSLCECIITAGTRTFKLLECTHGQNGGNGQNANWNVANPKGGIGGKGGKATCFTAGAPVTCSNPLIEPGMEGQGSAGWAGGTAVLLNSSTGYTQAKTPAGVAQNAFTKYDASPYCFSQAGGGSNHDKPNPGKGGLGAFIIERYGSDLYLGDTPISKVYLGDFLYKYIK